MPSFIVRTVNSSYSTQTRLDDLPNADAAQSIALRGALEIATYEVFAGSNAVTVGLSIEDADGLRIRASAVTISIAPLAVEKVAIAAVPDSG